MEHDLLFLQQSEDGLQNNGQKTDERISPRALFLAGEICPFCGQGRLDYDGMLNLICPACGKMETGGCT